MSGWSFGVGKIFGVEVRLHSFFVFLLVPAAVWAGTLGHSPARGFVLWALLLLAVVAREIARAVAAAFFDLDVAKVLLLPTGGLFSYAGVESETRAAEPTVQRAMALAGPVANALFGAILAAFILSIAPGIDLVAMPWVSPLHLLRTLVWVNLLLAALNFLPAWPLDAGRVARGEVVRGAGLGTAAARLLPRRLQILIYVGRWIALALVTYGIVAANLWALMAGLGVLLGAQVERQGLLPERESDGTRVGDVMLTEYSILPASATLEDAMMAARHSLQDVFPVVRAGNMVGAVGRQSILEALATSGNGYVQGIMTRSFQTASADDSLMETLNKAVGQGTGLGTGLGAANSLQIVPVVAGDTVVGILTPQHLQRSLGLIPRRLLRGGRSAAEDESD
jgi:CBS domain-containing protein